MSNHELGAVALGLLLLIAGAHLLGQVFARLRQPKVAGEILAGILIGPAVIGRIWPGFTNGIFGTSATDPRAVVLDFAYDLGLMLLMFVSGAGVRHILSRENRKPTAWLVGVGTPLPFVLAMAAAVLLPLDRFMGQAQSRPAFALVLAAAAAVTSIPVIAKIFNDLGILHTRFAGLLLGVAVLEDILLWAVLSVATAIAAGAGAGLGLAGEVWKHVALNVVYVGVAMTVAPRVLRRLSAASWNSMARTAPVAWMLTILLAYVALAAALEVTIVFAAFLAGYGIIGGMRGTEELRFRGPVATVNQVATASFIPVYFALVGFRLDFTRSFSLAMFVGFLLGSSALTLASRSLAGRLAGFRGMDLANIAVTANARGGPGIVMASVAFDAGIIDASLFTTLVLTAVITSQAAGFWLDTVLRRGRPLLAETTEPVAQTTAGDLPA